MNKFPLKLFPLLLACSAALLCAAAPGAPAPSAPAVRTVTCDQFAIRDPFVLPDAGTYYLYQSHRMPDGTVGVAARTSADLENWSPETPVMSLPKAVGHTAVWAPEVHKYAGAYWLFATLTFPEDPVGHPIAPMTEKGYKGGKLQPRGVWIFRSGSPRGPFVPVKQGSVTPADWMCLDGTLWVEDGVPWMVFCHEWCQTGNGRMMAAPMSTDLSRFTAGPIELFKASDAPGGGNVTDGPFLLKPKGAGLRMIWSNFLKGGGYCVLECRSRTGKIAGPWFLHTPVFLEHGGHGMVFNTFDGQMTLALHQPNSGAPARLKLFPLQATWEGLSRMDWRPFGSDWRKQWTPAVEKAIDDRIERHRKADAAVDGLPPGAEVKVEQLSSQFLFGSNMFNFDQLGSDAMNAAYRAAFTNLFNAATLAFYWKELEPEEGKPRFVSGPRDLPSFWNAFDFAHDEPERFVEWRRPAPDRPIDFCRANGVAMHGHAMIYVAWSPKWLWTKADTPAKAKSYYDAHVAELARRYGDVIPQWDVVNESLNRESTKAAPDDADNWYTHGKKGMVLPPDFTYSAFKVAEANFPPSVRLAINDAWSMRNDAYAAFAKKLRDRGAKIDVIGYQKHIFNPRLLLTVASGYPCLTNSQNWNVRDELDRLAQLDALGKPIHVSEITIPSPRGLGGLTDAEADEIQAKVTRSFYRLWFSWPSVDRITYWNLVDGMGIKHERMSSGWYNRDMSPKRVHAVMSDLILREWRTRLTARADAAGRLAFRGFKGGYRLTWKDASGIVRTRTIDVK